MLHADVLMVLNAEGEVGIGLFAGGDGYLYVPGTGGACGGPGSIRKARHGQSEIGRAHV